MITIDKYPIDWFKEEGNKKEWKDYDAYMQQVRNNFLIDFGAEKLEELDESNVLNKLFFNATGSKDNLSYMLEMDKDVRKLGSIAGGASYKYGLLFHKKDDCVRGR